MSLLLVGMLSFSACAQKDVEEGDTVAVQSVSMLAGIGTMMTDQFAGKVVSQDVIKVNKDGEKKVKEILVEVGDEVKAGDVLFTYDLEEINRNIESSGLELEKMRSEYEMMMKQRETLIKEKEKAPASEQLSYTMEIQEQEIAIKEAEYKITAKEKEIENMKKSLDVTDVKSETDGVIQSVNSDDNNGGYNSYDDYYGSGQGTTDAFITIMQTGSYRVKGQINEQNLGALYEGMPIIIRSRVDETVTWNGSISLIDTSKEDKDNNNNVYYGGENDYTSSTKYAFYVELDSLEGLMIGQHVYIEPDMGQAEVREGIWLSSYYLDIQEDGTAYAWLADDKDKLVHQAITLGEYDMEKDEYQIVEGITEKDYIAIPSEELAEGQAVTRYDDYYFDGGVDDGGLGDGVYSDALNNFGGEDMGNFDEDGNTIDLDGNAEYYDVESESLDVYDGMAIDAPLPSEQE